MAWYRYRGYQYIPGVGTVASWQKVKNIYRKTTPSSYTGTLASNFTDSSKNWRRHAAFYYKTSTGWKRVFTKTSTGVVFTTAPAIHVGGYGVNDGTSVSSPQYLNTVLYGKDGIWTPRNEISISRSFYASATPDGAQKFKIDGNDVLDLATNGYGADADETYAYYRIDVTNYGDTVTALAGPVKLIKREPSFNSSNLTGVESVGSVLTGTYSLENKWYNSPELYNSYIRWWRNTTTDPGGTLIREEYLGDHWSTNNTTSLQGSDQYTIQQADSGYYIVFQVVPYNSYNRHYGYETYYATPTTSTISAPLSVGSVTLEDASGNSALDNKYGVPTGTSLRTKCTITGINPSTTYRVRYRFLNSQNGSYYINGTAVSSGSTWQDTYTGNYYSSGNISSISISGDTAYISDSFFINSSYYNGSTWGGGIERWMIEVEVAAIKGTQVLTQSYLANIHAAANPTITPSVTTGSSPMTVTFSGTLSGVPSPYTAYPKSISIDFGDGSSPYTQSFSYGTGNPTYSVDHTYYSNGSYTPSISVIPNTGSANSSTITVATAPSVPTGLSGYGTTNGSYQQIYLSWNAASNVAYYELYYNGLGTTPPDSYPADYGANGSITSTNFTTPTASYAANTTYYWWVRAVSPGGVKSTWSARATVVTNSDILTAPSITSVTSGVEGGPVSVYFSGGSGPYYQMYWTSANPLPSQSYTPDASGSSSPLTDSTGPSLASTTWYAYVRSVATVGETRVGPTSYASAWSPGYSFTVAAPAPATPTGFSATTNRSDGVLLSWTASSGATSYEIWYGSPPLDSYTPDFYPGNVTSYLETAIPAGSSRTYYVRARNASGASPWSSGVTGTRTVAATKLGTPTGVSASTTRTDGVLISWNPVSNASYYGIWWGGAPGYDYSPDFPNIYSTSYLDTGIGAGSSRTYYVQAFSSSSSYLKSDWSSGATGTRASAPPSGTAAGTPSGLSNSYSGGPTWTGSWSASSGTAPITYYWTLYQSSSSGGAINATASGSTTGTSFTQSMSSGNGLWAYFTVYASNAYGTSGTATSGWA